MTVADLMEVAKTYVVALDGMNGKKLFDTSINKKEYYEKYYNVEITDLWSEMRKTGSSYNSFYKQILCCYILHKWEE